MVRISLEGLRLFMDTVKNVPKRVPNRDTVIKARFKSQMDQVEATCDQLLNFELDLYGDSSETKGKIFNIDLHYEGLLSRVESCKEGDIKSLGPILLPKEMHCCGKTIKINPDSSKGKLFARTHVSPVQIFTGHCRVPGCTKKFSHSYEEETQVLEGKKIVLRKFYQPTDVFTSSRETAYTEEFLQEATWNVVLGHTQFVNIARVYNKMDRNQGEVGTLGRDQLQTGYLLYHIAQKAPGLPLVVRRCKNRLVDVEFLCLQAAPIIRCVTLDAYLRYHECTKKGCGEKVIVIDGNMKQTRALCEAHQEKVMGTDGKPNLHKACLRNPDRGSKNRLCSDHRDSKDKPQLGRTSAQVDVRPETRSWAKVMEDSNLLGEESVHPKECRDPKNVKKFYHRTAGIATMIRPCLVRIGTFELIHHESISQMTVFLADLFGPIPQENGCKFVVFDRACGLARFFKERAEQNSFFHNYAELGFAMDKFHGDKHVDPECKLDSSKCKYNLRLPKFSYLEGMNSSAAERSYAETNKHTATTKYMTASKRLVYYYILEDMWNHELEKQLEKEGKLVSSGATRGWRNSFDYTTLYSSLVLNLIDGERLAQEVSNPAVMATEELGLERAAVTLNLSKYLDVKGSLLPS